MAKVTIPDKICPHCGGTEWYSNSKGYNCVKYMQEYNSKYTTKYHRTSKGHIAVEKARQKERNNLSDNYIRNSIYVLAYREGVKINRKNITAEQIERQRQSLIAFRQLKQLKTQNHDSKSETQENRGQFLRIGQQSSSVIYEQRRGNPSKWSSKSLQDCYAGNPLPNYVQRKLITINTNHSKIQEEMNTLSYSTSEIAMMENALSTGRPVNAIAKELSVQLNRSKPGVEFKLNALKKKMKPAKIQKSVEKSVDTRESSLRKEATVSVQTEFQWDVTPKRVIFCGDHVKVYF